MALVNERGEGGGRSEPSLDESRGGVHEWIISSGEKICGTQSPDEQPFINNVLVRYSVPGQESHVHLPSNRAKLYNQPGEAGIFTARLSHLVAVLHSVVGEFGAERLALL